MGPYTISVLGERISRCDMCLVALLMKHFRARPGLSVKTQDQGTKMETSKYLETHGTELLLIAGLKTRLIVSLTGLIGLRPFISRVIGLATSSY